MRESSLFVGYDPCSIYNAVEFRVYVKCCGLTHLAKNCNKDYKSRKCGDDHCFRDYRLSDNKSKSSCGLGYSFSCIRRKTK